MRLRMHRQAFLPLHDTSYFPDITVSIRSRRQTFWLRKCLVFTASLRKLSPLASVRMTFQWIKADLETIGCLGSGLNNQSVPRLLLRSNTGRKQRQNQRNQTKVWGSLTWKRKSLGSSPDTAGVLFRNIINVSSLSFNIQFDISCRLGFVVSGKNLREVETKLELLPPWADCHLTRISPNSSNGKNDSTNARWQQDAALL